MQPLRFAAPALLALLPACIVIAHGDFGDGPRLEGDGVAASEERPLGEVDGIELEGPIDLVVTAGASPALRVHADRNLLEHVETRERSGRLRIRLEPGYSYRLREPLRAEVSLPTLESVSIAGSSQVHLQGLDGERLTLAVSGAGNVVARGRVERLEISITGAGDVDAEGLVAERASVSIAGSGDVEMRVARQLDVQIAGSGDVRLHGDAQLSAAIEGSGEVKRIP